AVDQLADLAAPDLRDVAVAPFAQDVKLESPLLEIDRSVPRLIGALLGQPRVHNGTERAIDRLNAPVLGDGFEHLLGGDPRFRKANRRIPTQLSVDGFRAD